MASMTEDMTRLAGEIAGARGERFRLMREISQSNKDMKRAVRDMMGRFHTAHTQMMRSQRKALRGFTSELQHTVGNFRTAFASDLAGARAAFFGSVSAGPAGPAAPSGRGHARRAGKSHSEG